MLNKQTKGIQINKTAIVACFPLLTSLHDWMKKRDTVGWCHHFYNSPFFSTARLTLVVWLTLFVYSRQQFCLVQFESRNSLYVFFSIRKRSANLFLRSWKQARECQSTLKHFQCLLFFYQHNSALTFFLLFWVIPTEQWRLLIRKLFNNNKN